jgi:insertion element IS1 protein InsB
MAFCQKKTKTLWLWLAVDRERNIVIDFETGCRGSQTLIPLWTRVKETLPLVVTSDYWKPYNAVIPADIHLQTKAETYTVEGMNARIRHYLARFRRKTFCYSKSKSMVIASLKLLFALKLSIS